MLWIDASHRRSLCRAESSDGAIADDTNMVTRMRPGIHNTSAPPAAIEQVREFESMNEIKLPADYARFLLETNGERPDRANFKVPGWPGRASMVGDFFGIRTGATCSLQFWLTELSDTLPPGLIVIADDPSGNFLCLGTTGETAGQVYYWDPTPDWDLSEETGNTFCVAGSFDEFLESLC